MGGGFVGSNGCGMRGVGSPSPTQAGRPGSRSVPKRGPNFFVFDFFFSRAAAAAADDGKLNCKK